MTAPERHDVHYYDVLVGRVTRTKSGDWVAFVRDRDGRFIRCAGGPGLPEAMAGAGFEAGRRMVKRVRAGHKAFPWPEHSE